MDSTLLATKLYAPSIRLKMVRRSKLIRKLDEGLGLGRRIILVSAPAGYGKTSLITEWLDQVGLPFTWLSLDMNDYNPVQFFSYLIAALQKINTDIGQSAKSMLGIPQLPSADVLVTSLVNDMVLNPAPFILVLDDCHTIKNEYIFKAIQYLLDYQPATVHVVLITREDPLLMLSKWRVRGQLIEIRVNDLQFSYEETADFLRDSMNLNLKTEAVALLEKRTEGWIAGLQLAGLSLQGCSEEHIDEFIETFGGSQRYIIDYLIEEVLLKLDDKTREFIYQTALLDRFCAPLCDAVTGRNDSKAVLARLDKGNLFLIPLDDCGKWYRYHHLFSEILRSDIDPSWIPALHKKAAMWLENNGFLAEAVKHMLSSGDMKEAGRVIWAAANKIFEKGEITTLLDWLNSLPEEQVVRNSDLAAYKAWALFFTGQVKASASFTEINEKHFIDKSTPFGIGILRCLKAWFYSIQGNAEAIRLASEALEISKDTDLFLQSFALKPLGQAQRNAGDLGASTRTFREAYELAQKIDQPFAALCALMDLVFNLSMQGRSREALQLCKEAVGRYVDRQGNPLLITGIIYVPMGVFYYLDNELTQAREYIIKGLEACNQIGMERVVGGDGDRTLALAQYGLGDKEAAFATIQDAIRRFDPAGFPIISSRLTASEAQLYLKEGRIEIVAQWAGRQNFSFGEKNIFPFEQPHITYARLLLAQKCHQEALAVLENLLSCAVKSGRSDRIVQILVLQALAFWAAGLEENAVHSLEEAIKHALPDNFIRLFLEESPSLTELLPKVSDIAPEFVGRLLFAFSSQNTPAGSGCETEKPKTAIVGQPEEPLSERELEVLGLVAQGLSNKEIAARMFISPGTTKWHISNIFGKLGVYSRTQAIARARELKLV